MVAAARERFDSLPPVADFRGIAGSGAVGTVEGRRVEISRDGVSVDGVIAARSSSRIRSSRASGDPAAAADKTEELLAAVQRFARSV